MEWQSLSPQEAAQALKSDLRRGLSGAMVQKNTSVFGKNQLKEVHRDSLLKRFFLQFKDFMVLVLLCAAGISFGVSYVHHNTDYVDSIIILAIVILNAVIGTIQESRAEHALEALKKLSAPHARVIREGQQALIGADELVPGDLVLLECGDLVPADIRLIEGVNLICEESALTGESHGVPKNADCRLPDGTAIGDRKNMLFMGCIISAGHGKGLVVATGMDTQMGHIAGMIHNEKPPLTPLQQKLDKTGKVLGLAALGICAFIFLLGLLQKNDPLEMFMVSISLAVAAIPEGLPAVVTIVLAVGVRRMAQVHAIVRKMPSVEALGSASVICSDKTGTLTQNKMTVTCVQDIDGDCQSVRREKILMYGALCCNCVIQRGKLFGEATETAITRALETPLTQARDDFPRVAELPFSSERKMMSTLHRTDDGFLMITKGAPDYLLKKCGHYEENGAVLALSSAAKHRIEQRNDEMASNALRVLAVAYKKITVSSEFQEENLIFCGLIGIFDPPRRGVKHSVALCGKAGIRPVMITGDHKNTAVAIAKELRILRSEGCVMTGRELDKLDEPAFQRAVDQCDVFARVTPEHKVKIVRALQKNGEIVAMTGDGVNDAPALKAADIGCAMGKSGTEVAKESADLVLTDDDFSTIVAAVREGRGIYQNIRRTVHFLISCNIGEILTILAAVLMRLPAPLAAVQLLWVNLITDSLPALALGAEPIEESVMDEKPVKHHKGVFMDGELYDVLIEGLFIGALALLGYTIGRSLFDINPENPVIGHTMCLTVLSLSQIAHAFNLKSHGGKGSKLWGAALICVILQGLAIWFVPLASLLKTIPLSFGQIMIAALLSIMPIVVVKIEKLIKNVGFFHKKY